MSKIINISEAASIALHGIILIARSDGKINVLEIADLTSTSKHHVAKVLQRLVKAGFLYSHRGPQGGFSIKKDIKTVTLLDVYEAIEGKIDNIECMFEKEICPFGMCIMNNKAFNLSNEFRDYLKSRTISQYI